MNKKISESPFAPGAQVAAYLRDSGGTEQDLSVEQQELAIRKWCAENQVRLTQVFKDLAAPGSSTVGREGFKRAVAHFRGKAPEAGLVIWKMSRFARDMDDAQFYKADLRMRGYIIHSLNDRIPEGLNGRLLEAAIDFANARFLEDLSTDIKRGVAHLVSQYGALGGRPPVGFLRDPIELGRRRDGSRHIVHRWVPDPEKWEDCRTAWRMRAAGATYRQIHAATHLYGSKNCYKEFFANRIYLGELHFGDQVITNYCEPLITQEIWDMVQEKTNKGRPEVKAGVDTENHPSRVNSQYVLSGLVFCQECGSPLNGYTISFRDKPTYHYYACSKAKRRYEGGCRAGGIPKDQLEAAVFAELRDYITSEQMRAALRGCAQAMGNSSVEDYKVGIERLNRRIGGIRQKENHIMDLVLATQDDGEVKTFTRQMRALEKEEDDLSGQVKSLETSMRANAKASDLGFLERVFEMAAHLEEMSVEEKHVVLKGFVQKILVKREKRTVKMLVLFYTVPDLKFMSVEKCPCGDSNSGF